MQRSGNAGRAANRISDCVHNQLTQSPVATIFVLGDFNHCNLKSALPAFYQYVDYSTRKEKILDKCYGNIKNTFKAKTFPPLSNSDYLGCPSERNE